MLTYGPMPQYDLNTELLTTQRNVPGQPTVEGKFIPIKELQTNILDNDNN